MAAVTISSLVLSNSAGTSSTTGSSNVYAFSAIKIPRNGSKTVFDIVITTSAAADIYANGDTETILASTSTSSPYTATLKSVTLSTSDLKYDIYPTSSTASADKLTVTVKLAASPTYTEVYLYIRSRPVIGLGEVVIVEASNYTYTKDTGVAIPGQKDNVVLFFNGIAGASAIMKDGYLHIMGSSTTELTTGTYTYKAVLEPKE